MALDKFDFVPYREVSVRYSWGTDKSEFEDGTKKYLRRRIRAKKMYSFRISGLKAEMERVIEFYNKQRGLLDPFVFEYDGIREIVHFSSEININIRAEASNIVVYECDISLEVEKQATEYPPPSEDDVLPEGKGDVKKGYNWNTKVHTQGATQWRLKDKKPVVKMEVTFSGLKAARDKLITLFNSHETIPLLYKAHGKTYTVRFPSEIDITDKRESGKIVAFESQIELEVLDERPQ